MQNSRVPFIEFHGVGKRHDGKYVVRDLDSTVYQGEFFALVGGSGSRKSTALCMIGTLIEPIDGDVYLHGKRIKDYDIRQLRHQIDHVLQQIALFPAMTAAENIELMPSVLGWPKAERKTRTNELLELVELDPVHYRDHYPHELSGGEQQHVDILCAIAAKPQVLLVDEPFSVLDPLARTVLQDQIAMIHQKSGTTVVFVTHDMQEVAKLACRTGVVHNGKLVQIDTPEEIRKQPANDYMQSLFSTADAPDAERIIHQFSRLDKQGQEAVRRAVL